MLAVITVPAATAAEVIKLEASHFGMSPCSSVVRYDSSVGFSMNQVVGTFVVSALGLSDVSIAHASGPSHMSAKTRSTAKQTQLNNLYRLSYEADLANSPRVDAAVVTVSVAISGAPLLPADDRKPGEGDDQHDDEEQHRYGRAVTGSEVRETDVVDVLQGGARAE